MLKDQAGRVEPAGIIYPSATSDPSGGALALIRRGPLSVMTVALRHGRACPGYPPPGQWGRCGGCITAGAWMAGTRPAMTILGRPFSAAGRSKITAAGITARAAPHAG